jgi:DNA-directed RNA polymerase subunit RPC12/RpoP
MGRRDTIIYTCDDCGTEEEALGGLVPPEGWQESADTLGDYARCPFCADDVGMEDEYDV